jgi:L-fuconolactonase
VAGVVGWVDFESPDVDRRIAKLVEDGQGKLKGLRPMIQDIADSSWVRRSTLDAAFQSVIRHDLVFDALVRPTQLDALRERLVRHAGLRAVLDHAGKPGIAQGGFDAWSKGIERLARDTAVSIKLSGILTEAGGRASLQEISPYVEHVFRCFGPSRILWGSDWPVLNLASDYRHWLNLSHNLIQRFAPRETEAIFARNAAQLYGLDLPPKAQDAVRSGDTPA